jgi:nucleotide-binding universal stress UspA family protein
MTAAVPTPQPARSVLLCYDGSEHADQMIRRAAALLRPRTAVVLHARGPGRSGGAAESGAQLARHHNFDPVSAIEVNGPPMAKALLRKARQQRVALIVVGSHGRPASHSSQLGSVSSALVQRSDLPVLVVRSQEVANTADDGGPILVCYDGSAEAHGAIAGAADLLSDRNAIVASVLEPVDDVALLRTTLPWSPSAEMERRLARLDHEEAAFLAKRAAEGAALASSHGLTSRALAIEGPGSAWSRLLDVAATSAASCIVAGHRSAKTGLHSSTALELVQHADRPVLIVPH